MFHVNPWSAEGVEAERVAIATQLAQRQPALILDPARRREVTIGYTCRREIAESYAGARRLPAANALEAVAAAVEDLALDPDSLAVGEITCGPGGLKPVLLLALPSHHPRVVAIFDRGVTELELILALARLCAAGETATASATGAA